MEPESVAIPDDDGFLQAGIVLDRQNIFNETIYAGMRAVIPEVRDGDTRRQLTNRLVQLSPQNALATRPRYRHLPARHRVWQDLYDLAEQVLGGSGWEYRQLQRAILPGYVLRTDTAWESLVFTAISLGLKDYRVAKTQHRLGIRRTPSKGGRLVMTTPDITAVKQSGETLLIDAKYKGRARSDGQEALSIDPSDLYETLAFLTATDTDVAALVYPSLRNSNGSTGESAVFEEITVEKKRVFGVEVNPRGISGQSGLRGFSEGLCDLLRVIST